jgi:hypothetical protein
MLFPKELKVEDLQAFVESEGGIWRNDPLLPQGIFVEGEVSLFLRGIDSQQETLNQLTSEGASLGGGSVK